MLESELALTVHLEGQRTLIPGVLPAGKFSFSLRKVPSLHGEYLINLVISRVVSNASFISLDCFSASLEHDHSSV